MITVLSKPLTSGMASKGRRKSIGKKSIEDGNDKQRVNLIIKNLFDFNQQSRNL